MSRDVTAFRYGLPSRVSPEDAAWLKKLDGEIWDRSKDRFGSTHSFESHKRKLLKEELKRVLKLVVDHRLPCVLGSGPYGNLSMSIWDHSDVPQVRPDRLISLGEDHVGLEKGFDRWDDRFKWFSAYTHSDEVRQVLAFYNMPMPEPKLRYEY